MRKNRCLKLTALLLIMMFISIASVANATTTSGVAGGYNPANSRNLEGFVTNAETFDANGNGISLSAESDPTGVYTLHLEIREPEEALLGLPENTDEIRMYYPLQNMSAVDGSNETDVSWTYEESDGKGELVFKWLNGKKISFSADITVSPKYENTTGLGGNKYLIVSKGGNGVILPIEKSGSTIMAEKGSFAFDDEGNVIHAVKDDPLWYFEQVAGDWYNISCNGLYIHINGSNVTLNSDPAVLFVKKNGDYYEIGYNGYNLDAIGGDPAKGIQGYTKSLVQLYSESQISANGNLGLGGKDLYIANEKGNETQHNIMLPTPKESAGGKLDGAFYSEVSNNTIIPYGISEKWHFENAGRNYYYISNNGQYLTLSEGGASLSSSPTKLLVMSNGTGYSIMDESPYLGNVLELECENNDKYVGGAFQGYRNAGKRYYLRFYENAIEASGISLAGEWAIVNPNTEKAILGFTNANGTVKTTQYKNVSGTDRIKAGDGKTEITLWNIKSAGKTNWYYITNSQKQYLNVTGTNVSLSSSPEAVYIQDMGDGLFRITNGKTNAANISYFDGNNTLISYSDRGSHEKMQIRKVDGQVDMLTYPLYNIAYIRSKNWYCRLAKTEIKTTVTLEDKLKGTNPNNVKPLSDSEYAVEEYVFDDLTITVDKKEYIYDCPKNETAIANGARYYTVEFMSVGAVNHKIGGLDGNKNPRWLIPEDQRYADVNETDSFHRDYEISLYDNPIEQDLYNMLSVNGSNDYHRLQKGTIVARPADEYKKGETLKSGYEIPDGDYDFTNVELVIDGVTYKYSDHELEGEYEPYYTVSFIRVIKKDMTNTNAKWFNDDSGWLDGANYKVEGNNVPALHRDYLATTHEGTMPEVEEPEIERSVVIESDWPADKLAYPGAEITLHGTIQGFSDDCIMQWQHSEDRVEWTDQPGANEIDYTYIIDENTAKYYWRLVVNEKEQ